jgi:hypothetical protein
MSDRTVRTSAAPFAWSGSGRSLGPAASSGETAGFASPSSSTRPPCAPRCARTSHCGRLVLRLVLRRPHGPPARLGVRGDLPLDRPDRGRAVRAPRDAVALLEGGHARGPARRPRAAERLLARAYSAPPKSTSSVFTVPAVRPGTRWLPQYRFVKVMTWSGGGAPHSVRSSVVWASLTRVAS